MTKTVEPEERREHEAPTMDRKQFIKTLGAAIGAIGLGMGAGSVSANARRDMQGFIRTLLKEPDLAKAFLEDPVAVAREHEIQLSEADAAKIQRSAQGSRMMEVESGRRDAQMINQGDLRVVPGASGGPRMNDCSWHDFPECHHVASNIEDQRNQLINPGVTRQR